MAAMLSRIRIVTKFKLLGRAAKVPMAKRSESPGRNGVTTKPVSQKMIAKSRT
jgi:hypothetical protein